MDFYHPHLPEQDIQLIRDFIVYSKNQITQFKFNLEKAEKELLAARISDYIHHNNLYEKFEKVIPIINDIEALATDLEWSNAFDVDDDWEKLINYVGQLDQQINGAQPVSIKKITRLDVMLAQDFIAYCKDQFTQYRVDIEDKKKELIANQILNYMHDNNLRQKFEKELSIIIDIEEFASNLKWSNVTNLSNDWSNFITAVDEFERQIMDKHPKKYYANTKNAMRSMPKDFNVLATPADVIKYCKNLALYYRSYLPKEVKQQLAISIAAIVTYSQDFIKAYSMFDRIEHLVNSLKQPNNKDIDKNWKELIDAINKLDQQINNKKLD